MQVPGKSLSLQRSLLQVSLSSVGHRISVLSLSQGSRPLPSCPGFLSQGGLPCLCGLGLHCDRLPKSLPTGKFGTSPMSSFNRSESCPTAPRPLRPNLGGKRAVRWWRREISREGDRKNTQVTSQQMPRKHVTKFSIY